MKLFAPRNDWNMANPQTWWGMSGTAPTASGVRVDVATAMQFSAVFAATRIISETLASLPCSLLEQIDYRTTRKATDVTLWSILHDQPNPEQDIMSWLDSQVAFQLNWGDAYAEIQRNSVGEIIALWMIHPSRIPLKNIVRNSLRADEYRNIQAGQPGEIVYYVNNDDGSASPIAASDMLHVPGVLSTNGVTGQSIVKWGANSIGNALAADRHAGALFLNGAVTNMAIKSPKVVGPDTAEKLRRQWQQMFGGVQNHYKTLLLEDGMEPVPINMLPEDTQLLETRQFGVTEIARWYRLPPHLLGDLTRSTNNNIETQGLEFIIYSMMPWIVRWEKALQRQLLTETQKKQYRFKFNVNGLLRGDQTARAAFYQTMFNLGAYSPNDIREKEDENPIDGGDQYFIQGNNAVPLDKVGALAQAQIDKANQPAPASQQPNTQNHSEHLIELRSMMLDMIAKREQEFPQQIADTINSDLRTKADTAIKATRKALLLAIQGEVDQLMRYESRAAIQAAKKPETFLAWRDAFYPNFAAKLAAAISVFVPAAEAIDVCIDSLAEAESYIQVSIQGLESLGDLPCKDLEVGVERLMEAWADRPAKLASAIFGTAA